MPRPKGSKNRPKTVKAYHRRRDRIDHCQYRCIESRPENQEGLAQQTGQRTGEAGE